VVGPAVPDGDIGLVHANIALRLFQGVLELALGKFGLFQGGEDPTQVDDGVPALDPAVPARLPGDGQVPLDDLEVGPALTVEEFFEEKQGVEPRVIQLSEPEPERKLHRVHLVGL